jgi:hypothetical protein
MLATSDLTGMGGPGMMDPMFPPEPSMAPEPAPMYPPMTDTGMSAPKPKKKKAAKPKAKRKARKPAKAKQKAKRAKPRKPAKKARRPKARKKRRR